MGLAYWLLRKRLTQTERLVPSDPTHDMTQGDTDMPKDDAEFQDNGSLTPEAVPVPPTATVIPETDTVVPQETPDTEKADNDRSLDVAPYPADPEVDDKNTSKKNTAKPADLPDGVTLG